MSLSQGELTFAAAQEDKDVGKWKSQERLIHVLLWEQASHVYLVQHLLLMFVAALLSSGVVLPLYGYPKELRMQCSSGDSMEHKYLVCM